MISLERVVIFETSRVLKSHVFRQHFLLKNLVFGDQKWSIFGPKMVDFWSKKAIQKKDEIFDEIVSQQGVLPPGQVPAPPPEPLPKSRFARSNLNGRTRTRAFRHLGSTGTESANSFKTMISIIFGPGRDTSLQKSFGPGLLQGCYRDI